MSEIKNCPCCGSEQVQWCIDSNNAAKDRAKCRMCGLTGLVSSWNRRQPSGAGLLEGWRVAEYGAGIKLTAPNEDWRYVSKKVDGIIFDFFSGMLDVAPAEHPKKDAA